MAIDFDRDTKMVSRSNGGIINAAVELRVEVDIGRVSARRHGGGYQAVNREWRTVNAEYKRSRFTV